MLLGETVAVNCESHTEHTDTLCGQEQVLGNRIVFRKFKVRMSSQVVTILRHLAALYSFAQQNPEIMSQIGSPSLPVTSLQLQYYHNV
jgi:hypothetical protein